MVLITIMEHLPPLRSLGLSLSPRSSHSSPSTDCSLFYLYPFLSLDSRLALLCRAYAPPFARAHSRSRTAPLTPLRPSSTLCSVPRRWRQLSGYLKRKILISPLERVRFSRARFQWSFNGRRGSARRRGRGRHRRWRGEKKKKSSATSPARCRFILYDDTTRHETMRNEASTRAPHFEYVRSLGILERVALRLYGERERKRKRGREPREKFRTSLSEIYRRRGRNKSMARDARERGWR